MKQSIFYLMLFISITGYCGDKKSIVGNWREVSRKNVSNTPINYTDTIFLEFLSGNEYIWQKSGGFIYRGTYKYEVNAIDIGMRYFTVVSQNNNTLVLKDEAGVYEMQRYTPKANTPEAKRQEVYAPVNSIQQMTGHWSVYKRTSANKTNAIDYSRQLKMVDFYPNQQDGKWGAFYATKDADNAPSWVVESFSNQTVYLNGKDQRQFRVLKCEGGELIMEENGVTYYFKQFK